MMEHAYQLKASILKDNVLRSSLLQEYRPYSFSELQLDKMVLLSAISLALMGVVMVASSSVGYAEYHHGDPLSLAKRHLLYLALGVSFASAAFLVPIRVWERCSWVLLLVGMLLLCLVLVPGIGHKVNGSQRWIRFAGLTLQSSEVAKFCMVMYLAGYLVRRQAEVISQWRGFIKPMMVLAVFGFLLYLEPDFGALVVLMSSCLGMMFLAGLGLRQLLAFGIGSGALMTAMVASSNYRMARFDAFTKSLSEPFADQFGHGYQLAQSLIAIGRGEWFGVGLGNSVQKLFYLPEAHTDFVFAIMAEEFGLIGVIAIILLYMILINRSLFIGKRAEQTGHFFAANVVYGFTLIIAAQTFINIGVNCGLLPTKGLTLPFLSYGGSSLIVCCLFVAIILRVNYEVLGPVKKSSNTKRAKKTKQTARPVPQRGPIPTADAYEEYHD